ncbi:MAG: PEP-CTERM sorting domain-containing protein, partial [Phycisphaerales bacterium]
IAYDAVNVAGLLTYNGDLTFNITAPVAGGVYDLFALSGGATGNLDSVSFAGGVYAGTFSRTGDIWTADAGGQTFSFDQLSGDLSVTAIPEPSTTALLIGSGLLVVAVARRRTRRA